MSPLEPMLNDRLNPDRDAEQRYLRFRTYALCIMGECIILGITFMAGVSAGVWLFPQW